MKSMPASASIRLRYMRPCARSPGARQLDAKRDLAAVGVDGDAGAGAARTVRPRRLRRRSCTRQADDAASAKAKSRRQAESSANTRPRYHQNVTRNRASHGALSLAAGVCWSRGRRAGERRSWPRARRAGAVPVAYPTIEVAPPPDWAPLDARSPRRAPAAGSSSPARRRCGFTTARAARDGRARGARGGRIAAVGPETARALAPRGSTSPSCPPRRAAPGGVARGALADARARRARPVPAGARRARAPARRAGGAAVAVDVVPVSQTARRADRAAAPAFDAAPSRARRRCAPSSRAGGAALAAARVAVIGPTTARQLPRVRRPRRRGGREPNPRCGSRRHAGARAQPLRSACRRLRRRATLIRGRLNRLPAPAPSRAVGHEETAACASQRRLFACSTNPLSRLLVR